MTTPNIEELELQDLQLLLPDFCITLHKTLINLVDKSNNRWVSYFTWSCGTLVFVFNVERVSLSRVPVLAPMVVHWFDEYYKYYYVHIFYGVLISLLLPNWLMQTAHSYWYANVLRAHIFCILFENKWTTIPSPCVWEKRAYVRHNTHTSQYFLHISIRNTDSHLEAVKDKLWTGDQLLRNFITVCKGYICKSFWKWRLVERHVFYVKIIFVYSLNIRG